MGDLFVFFENMKNRILFSTCILTLLGCQNNKNKSVNSVEEKKDLEKVEIFEKTDKEKEDSVMAHWEKKMQESKLKD